MRLPHPHFMIRRLMVLVAILGIILGAVVIGQRWHYARSMATHHADEVQRMRLLLAGGRIVEPDETGTRKLRIGQGIERDEVERRLIRYALMEDRYQRAARRPWLSVDPDPSEPTTSTR